MKAPGYARVVNAILFKFLWPSCVVGAAFGQWWIGAAVLASLTLWQALPNHRVRGDIALFVLLLPVGLVLDTLWIQAGLLEYDLQWPWPGFAPGWILFLWAGLALAINHCLLWMQQHLLLSGIIVAVASPLSYYSAAQIGAVTWTAPGWQVVLATGLSWALLIPAVLYLARTLRLNGRFEFAQLSPGPGAAR